jgi:ribonuclease D
MSVIYIDNQTTLDEAIHQLNQRGQFAVDLEFDKNYHRYGFNLCLVQIFDRNDCYLIDPLSNNLDIQTLFPTLENPAIEKLTFAFGEDLRLMHSLGCFPKNIYDLDIATSLLNYPPSSLTNLIQDILEVDTGKSSQLSNWFKRPLTDQQIHYAAQDVLHLFDLKKVLIDQAEKREVLEWIEEENRIWDQLDYSNEDNNGVLKEKDKKGFNEVEWHIFKELMHYREQLAEKYNKPSFQVVKKEYISEVAKDVRKLMRWTDTKGVFRGIKNDKVKSELIEIVKNAKQDAEKLGLSEKSLALKTPTKEEMKLYREQQKKLNRLKSKFFDPIKKRIEEDYGQETAIFLFSNRIIAELADGGNGDLAEYKRRLLVRYTEQLNLEKDYLISIIGD